MDVRQQDSVEIYLTCEGYNAYAVHQGCDVYKEMVDNVPPVAGVAKVTPSKKKAERNAKRLLYEDSLRNAYVATFPTQTNYRDFIKVPNAADNNLKRNFTDEQLWEIIHRSEGNYHEIISFIEKNYWYEPGFAHAYDYLKTFSDKDMSTAKASCLHASATRWYVHGATTYPKS